MAHLRFEADLEVTSGGTTMAVTNDNDTLVVTVDDWRRTAALVRRPGRLPFSGLGRVARQLEQAGATVRFDSPTGTLLTLGEGVTPNAPVRFLGAAPLKVGNIRSYRQGPMTPRARLLLGTVGLTVIVAVRRRVVR